jgi:hypothetical protein
MPAFTVRIFKSWDTAANKNWVNTYEYSDGSATGTGDPAALSSVVDALVTAERSIHLNRVQFNRYTISTWLPDSQPYSPQALVTVPLGLTGNVDPTANSDFAIEDLRIVLRVDRRATHGRPGKLFYRGCLMESAVRTSGGRMALDTNADAPLVGRLNAFRQMFGLDGGGVPMAPGNYALAMVSGTLQKAVVPATSGTVNYTRIKRTYVAPFSVRQVSAIVPIGPTILSNDHRYFDRP